jgi:hypothetical protein
LLPPPSAHRTKYLPGPLLGKCLDQRTLEPAISPPPLTTRRKRQHVLDVSGAARTPRRAAGNRHEAAYLPGMGAAPPRRRSGIGERPALTPTVAAIAPASHRRDAGDGRAARRSRRAVAGDVSSRRS